MWPLPGEDRQGHPTADVPAPTERETDMPSHAQWSAAWRASAANEREQGNEEGADYGDYLADQNANADAAGRP